MTDFADRMDAIMLSDNDRRDAQALSDWMMIQGDATEPDYDYHGSRSLTMEPSEANRTYRATESSWTRGLRMTRTVGTATVYGSDLQTLIMRDGDSLVFVTRGDAVPEGCEPTVRVTRNGATRIAGISEFRATREASEASEATETPEVARIARDSRDIANGV